MSEIPRFIDQEADTHEQALARRGRPFSDYLIEKLNAKVDYAATLEARIARLEALLREAVGREYGMALRSGELHHRTWHERAIAALDDAEGA